MPATGKQVNSERASALASFVGRRTRESANWGGDRASGGERSQLKPQATTSPRQAGQGRADQIRSEQSKAEQSRVRVGREGSQQAGPTHTTPLPLT
jgi:hypothetical protein